MEIAVLGTGPVGRTLGARWSKAGHHVVFGTRDPASLKTREALLAAGPTAQAAFAREALAWGEVVLIAVPATAVAQLVADHGGQFGSKVVIDATNRFGEPIGNHLATIAAAAPEARLVRAFNTLSWEVFEQPVVGGIAADLFYCSVEDARTVAEQVIGDIGLRPVRVGGLDQAPLVDAVGSLWAQLARHQGWGRRLAFKTLTG
jgi:predicted dinucleotide-binding enzyme